MKVLLLVLLALVIVLSAFLLIDFLGGVVTLLSLTVGLLIGLELPDAVTVYREARN